MPCATREQPSSDATSPKQTSSELEYGVTGRGWPCRTVIRTRFPPSEAKPIEIIQTNLNVPLMVGRVPAPSILRRRSLTRCKYESGVTFGRDSNSVLDEQRAVSRVNPHSRGNPPDQLEHVLPKPGHGA